MFMNGKQWKTINDILVENNGPDGIEKIDHIEVYEIGGRGVSLRLSPWEVMVVEQDGTTSKRGEGAT
jgi:hypothetical protein